MSRDIEILERLGAFVAEDLGEGPSEERLIMQRRDFLDVVSSERKSSRGLFYIGAAAAAVLVLALGVFLATQNSRATVRFWVGDSDVFGQEGQWVRTGTTSPLPIRFEGGTEFVLAPNASARMVRSTKKEVKMDLASGKVHCEVNKNNVTKWHIVAGPYTITVTGTIFEARWDPKSGDLDVDVARGSVLVSGADLSEHGVRLAKGDHLKVDGERAVISLSGDSEGERYISIEEVILPDENDQIDAEQPGAGDTMDFRGTRKKRGMRNIMKNGAIDGVGRHGTEEVSDPDKMSLEALWQAASKARYDKNAGRAESLLLTVKRRFPGARQAQAVPFLMGRIQLELKRNPRESQKWFKQYLRETPKGPLAEEALGRLIDACKRSGDGAGAKRYAERYLKNYENGVFGDLAASVVSD